MWLFSVVTVKLREAQEPNKNIFSGIIILVYPSMLQLLTHRSFWILKGWFAQQELQGFIELKLRFHKKCYHSQNKFNYGGSSFNKSLTRKWLWKEGILKRMVGIFVKKSVRIQISINLLLRMFNIVTSWHLFEAFSSNFLSLHLKVIWNLNKTCWLIHQIWFSLKILRQVIIVSSHHRHQKLLKYNEC